MAKTYHRTVWEVVVLSEEPIPDDMSLVQVLEECRNGDYSGIWDITNTEKLTGKEMATALSDQGSDPSFFGLTEDGEPIDDGLCDNCQGSGGGPDAALRCPMCSGTGKKEVKPEMTEPDD